MKILICGGRDFTDEGYFWEILDAFSNEWDFDNNQPITIIAGGAKGADKLAKDYAEECGWEYEEYKADWEKHGRRAGPIRNRQMLEEGKPDCVIAFWDGKSRGTKNMIDISKDTVTVFIYGYPAV